MLVDFGLVLQTHPAVLRSRGLGEDAIRRAQSPRLRVLGLQGYGSPIAVYLAYALKIAGYVAGWFFFCGFSPGMGHVTNLEAWWLEPAAFQKAIVWSMLFELLGLGCGSGPLTGRYLPPVGGFLYFLRPGTTKLPVLRGAPLVGGHRRNLIDVLAYATTVGVAIHALVSCTH